MYEFSRFGLSELVRLSTALRAIDGVECLEDVAQTVVGHLYDHLVDKEVGGRASVLVRFYKTHRFSRLPGDVREFAARQLESPERPSDLRCLTLLATAGEQDEWNDRRQSRGHQAIPLVSAKAVAASPMLHRLITQLGFDIEAVVQPDVDLIVDPRPQTYNVFHVPEARGSPYVPAQEDFVIRAGVRSVLGFGGLLPDGELFAVIMFVRTAVSRATAELFRPVALSVTAASLPYCQRVFVSDPPVAPDPRRHEWEAVVLRQLLGVHEAAVLDQATRLEQALTSLDDQTKALTVSQEVLRASEARKAAVVESALDAIVTMDEMGRIVEFNPAAERIFGYERGQAVGAPMAELLVPEHLRQAHHEGLARYLATGEGPIIGQRIEITARHASGAEFPVELTVTRVEIAAGGLFTAYVRDLTLAKRTEAELRELADTLQASLLPPKPPEIPGLEVATLYRPAARGLIVGGDFFDVFRTGDSDWGVVIGDVCGKGARAAALTALARYTVRAAASHGSPPSEVLGQLNAALVETDDDLHFCSAAYSRIRFEDGKVVLTTASGGHPPPLIASTGGRVDAGSAPGMLVGMFEEFAAPDTTVTIGPGGVVLYLTDGIVEARNDRGELFGDERLMSVLAESSDLPAVGIADAVLDAVLRFATTTTDDVALLVLKVPRGPEGGPA